MVLVHLFVCVMMGRISELNCFIWLWPLMCAVAVCSWNHKDQRHGKVQIKQGCVSLVLCIAYYGNQSLSCAVFQVLTWTPCSIPFAAVSRAALGTASRCSHRGWDGDSTSGHTYTVPYVLSLFISQGTISHLPRLHWGRFFSSTPIWYLPYPLCIQLLGTLAANSTIRSFETILAVFVLSLKIFPRVH